MAWQILNGEKKQVEVAYEIHDGVISFKTGEYNKDHEVIIDPIYQWVTSFGSTGNDEGWALAVDNKGNAYITGYSTATWGTPLHPFSGEYDISVVKLNNDGSLAWNTFYGSDTLDMSHGIAVDNSGNVYVTGESYKSWGNPLHVFNVGSFWFMRYFYFKNKWFRRLPVAYLLRLWGPRCRQKHSC